MNDANCVKSMMMSRTFLPPPPPPPSPRKIEVVRNLCTTNHELWYRNLLAGTSVTVEGYIRIKMEAVYPSKVSVRFHKTTRIDMKGDCDVITLRVSCEALDISDMWAINLHRVMTHVVWFLNKFNIVGEGKILCWRKRFYECAYVARLLLFSGCYKYYRSFLVTLSNERFSCHL